MSTPCSTTARRDTQRTAEDFLAVAFHDKLHVPEQLALFHHTTCNSGLFGASQFEDLKDKSRKTMLRTMALAWEGLRAQPMKIQSQCINLPSKPERLLAG